MQKMIGMHNRIYFDKDEPAGGATEKVEDGKEAPGEAPVEEKGDFSFLLGEEEAITAEDEESIPEVKLEDIQLDMEDLFDIPPVDDKDKDKDKKAPEDDKDPDKDKKASTDDKSGDGDDKKTPDGDDKNKDKKSPEPDPEILELKDRISQLNSTIQELSKPKNEDGKEDKKEEVTKLDLGKISEKFKDIDFDKIAEDKDEFIKFAISVAAAVYQENTSAILNTVPSIVDQTINYKNSYEKIRTDFYSKHAPLQSVKTYVAAIAEGIAKDNPNLTVGETLEKAAETAYKNLGIDPTKVAKPTDDKDVKSEEEKKKEEEEQAKKLEEEKKKKAKLPGAQTKRSKGAVVSKLQEEMEDLFRD